MTKNQEIGKRLKAVLASRKIKQKQLAEKTGLTESMISYMIKGTERGYSHTAIIKICSALEISSDYLLGIPTFKETPHDNSKIIYLLNQAIEELNK
jgi:transcriptional regulator with XRE-family HTH domain